MIRSSDPDRIHPYLEDASNLSGGYASEVVFPESEKEVSQILAEANYKKIPVTVAGNGTGLTGARIPFGGIVLATDKLGGVQEVCIPNGEQNGCAIVGAGTTLHRLQETVAEKGLLYPPDPTEQNAFIGASVSTNGSGARSLKYGSTRRWIRRLRVILSDGSVVELSRGEQKISKDGTMIIKTHRTTLAVPIPSYRVPPIKSAAGYYIADGMDVMDLFIGAEGTLGVVTLAEVELIPKPQGLISGVIFFQREESAWKWVDEARTSRYAARVLEYLDSQSLGLLREKYSRIPLNAESAIFFEQELIGPAELELGKWLNLSKKHSALLDESWVATSLQEQEEFKKFRYAIPVQVNELLYQFHQTKVGTDFAVPNRYYFDMLKCYKEFLQSSGLSYCLFGHIGENHLHLNLIPRNPEETKKAWDLYHKIAQQVIAWGGTIAAEHGIGKLRRQYLLAMYGQKGIEEMAQIKKSLDPNGILGRGNIFSEEFLN